MNFLKKDEKKSLSPHLDASLFKQTCSLSKTVFFNDDCDRLKEVH